MTVRTAPLFNVSFEIVTEESAADGEAESRGYCAESVTLRDAILAATADVGDFEGAGASDRPTHNARWFSLDSKPDYLSGRDYWETRSIHFPETLRKHSRRRVIRYLENADLFRVRSK